MGTVRGKTMLVSNGNDGPVFNGAILWLNKTGTSQVGAISKAQKAQNIFLEKNLKFSKNFFFRKMSHRAEKCKRGTLFDL